MENRIDLSFSRRTAGPPASPPEYAHVIGEGEQQDTAGLDESEVRDKNLAELENLRIGQNTVAEVVRGLGKVLGQELYPSKILQQDDGTTRVFVEQKLPPRKTKAKTIYDITDGGEVSTDMARLPGITHRLEDHQFVKFQTRFTKAPSVLVGLNYLHQSRNANVRITGAALDIHDHLFDMFCRSWADTIFHGAGFTWLAVPTDENPLLQTGKYSTGADHAWDVQKDLTHGVITFKPPYKSPPKVVVWLTEIDSNLHFNERVNAFATDITTTGFTININTWGGTFLYTGVVSWFAYPADTPGICSGYLQPTQGTAGVVTFEKPFTRPPRRVLVALNKLETDKSADCRFKIVREAVSERGMGIRVESWGDSKIHTAGVAYIAME